MPTPTVVDYLKYSRLQMAAEALYGFYAGAPNGNLQPGVQLSFPNIDPTFLTDGNRHASKFTSVDARVFVQGWRINGPRV